jgi:hypothetical protein
LAFSRTLVTLLTKILVLRNELIYFVKHETKSNKCYTENEVISMLEFLIDSISVEFGGHIFQQIIGISMGTNWSPLLDDLFPYSFSCWIYAKTFQRQKTTEAKAFNITFRYIDDDQPINNPHVANWIPLIYHKNLEIKETAETASSVLFLDMYLDFDTIFNFLADFMTKETSVLLFISFPPLDSNIPTAPAYGVYISQLKLAICI